MISRFIKNPLLWLGLGLGIALGVSFSSGLEMSPQDATRFAGALLGALIAVAGAISLHFLKEQSEQESRRKNLERILEQGLIYLKGITAEIDNKDFSMVTGGLQTAARYVDRCKRYCQAHECDDLQIGMVGNLFDHIDGQGIEEFLDDDDQYSLETLDEIREAVKLNVNFFEEGLRVIRASHK